ncbi:MAG: CinA family protein [bacterium]|nr:CinA family protein [bacterium]
MITNLEKLSKFLLKNKLTISTAESCTGGLLSSKLTDISGSSAYIKLNLITYANEAKQKMLEVDKTILETKGAVSEECAYQMAKGLYKLTKSDICISTTGIAGPTGGTNEKPVGLMYSCIYTPEKYKIYRIQMPTDVERIQMKELFADEVIKNIVEFMNV